MNAHRLPRWLSISLTLLALPISPWGAAGAQAPDADRLIAMDDRLVHANRTRVTTAAGWAVLRGTRADVEGLSYLSLQNSSPGNVLPSAGRLGWQEITRVDVPVNHGLRYGLITGLVLTAITVPPLIAASSSGNDIGGGGIILAAIPLGALIATGIGAARPAWHRIHPSRR